MNTRDLKICNQIGDMSVAIKTYHQYYTELNENKTINEGRRQGYRDALENLDEMIHEMQQELFNMYVIKYSL